MIYRIPGRLHDLDISFPLERGVLLSIIVKDKTGIEIDRFDKMIPENIFNQYRMYMPFAKEFLATIMNSR